MENSKARLAVKELRELVKNKNIADFWLERHTTLLDAYCLVEASAVEGLTESESAKHMEHVKRNLVMELAKVIIEKNFAEIDIFPPIKDYYHAEVRASIRLLGGRREFH